MDREEVEQLRAFNLALAKKLGAKYIWIKGKREEVDYCQKSLEEF